MGFYIRRGVSVGPFRFNLSKSGLGLSVGVKGFRVGTGPRGNYVHMGRGGLYFRSALPGAPPAPISQAQRLQPQPTSVDSADNTLAPFEEINSASPLQLSDSSSTELIREISAKSRVPRLFPWALIGGVAAVAILVTYQAPLWAIALVAVGSLVVLVLAKRRDTVARAVVLLYDLDDAAREAYGRLHTAFDSLQAAGRLWHVEAAAAVRDRKYHAGASSVLKRTTTTVKKGEPPVLKTNVEAVLLPAGRQVLAFMPDRLLVFGGGAVAGIGYDNLTVQVDQTRFVESDAPPPDAKIVETTWRYVNKSGGPDRRFTNNRQLPVALYEEIQFRSASGLNELIQSSRLGVGRELQEAVGAIAKISRECIA